MGFLGWGVAYAVGAVVLFLVMLIVLLFLLALPSTLAESLGSDEQSMRADPGARPVVVTDSGGDPLEWITQYDPSVVFGIKDE